MQGTESMSDGSYTIKPFSPFRQLVVDGLVVGSGRHIIHGLIEADVTRPRQRLREMKEQTASRFR